MIYKVVIDFRGYSVYEIDAPNEDLAEEQAIKLLHDEVQTDFVETYDAVVTKADNQYTAEQECEDDDRRGNC